LEQIILQVEDDADDVYLFQHAMDQAGPGCSIRVVSDGQMAIEYLKGSGKFADRKAFPLPCLVLLDLKLPHLTGLEVLKWIRGDAGFDVPVVILSASQQRTDIATAYRLGANAYLAKPTEHGELLEMARMITGFWVKQNIPPPRVQSCIPGGLTGGPA
jgi:CheY-like chemotaxis protein